jgi:uncharacterized membrane protein YqjE
MNQTPERASDKSIVSALKELISGLQSLIRGEIHLAKAEMKGSIKEAGRNAALTAVFAVFLILGLFPWMAFLVIGLGLILRGNYWLSSLIVSVVHLAIGGFLAIRYGKRILNEELRLPRTRKGLHHGTDLVKGQLASISKIKQKETYNRRAA